jgi:hypothetical protein
MGFEVEPAALLAGPYFDAPTVDLESYSRIIVCLSGKDSVACLLACLLTLIEQGADMSRLELWHHAVDAGHPNGLMDWTFNDGFVEKFAEAFNVPCVFFLAARRNRRRDAEAGCLQPTSCDSDPGWCVLTLERDKTRSAPDSPALPAAKRQPEYKMV